MLEENTILKKSLLGISWPILIENFLRMASIFISYWIFSLISDDTAAVMSVINLCLLSGFILVESVAQSNSILINQYLGNSEKDEKKISYSAMLWFSLLLGVIVSLIFFNFSHVIIEKLVGAGKIFIEGNEYLKIVGSFFFIYSVGYMLTYMIYSHGYTRYGMLNSLLVNMATIIVSFFIVIQKNLLSSEKITILAITNVSIRAFGVLILWFLAKFYIKFLGVQKISWHEIKKQFSYFWRLGVPSLFEPLIYYLFQLIFVKIISGTSTNALAIRAYIVAITGFFETIAWSIARGNQIIIGKFLGSKKFTVANFALIEGILWSCFFSLILIGAILPFRYIIIRFFSNNVEIVNIGAQLLLFVALITLFKAINFNFSSALKSAGDVKFCVILITVSMWGITVPSCFLLVKYFNIGLVDIWAILCIEEIMRFIFFHRRWKSNKWQKNLIKFTS